MKIFLWYTFVVLDAFILIFSLIYHNIYITALGFVIALVLSKYNNNIPFPKQFEKLKYQNKNKNK